MLRKDSLPSDSEQERFSVQLIDFTFSIYPLNSEVFLINDPVF